VPDLGSDRIDFELDLLAVGLVCFDLPNAVLKFDLGYYLKSLLLDGLDYLRERFRIHRRELVGEPPCLHNTWVPSTAMRTTTLKLRIPPALCGGYSPTSTWIAVEVALLPVKLSAFL
jgi:hypothetical protein